MRRRQPASKQCQGYSERSHPVREQRQRFLIICEGEKTEPNYFRAFSALKEVIDLEVLGLGLDPQNLVEQAIAQQEQARKARNPYDQVWCVFDRDSWPVTLFNRALEDVRRADIKAAYSNEAFELWYLLHFHYYDTACTRRDYQGRLSTQLGTRYEKNDRGMYIRLIDRQQAAIRNADRLLSQYDPPDPANDNPSTTVHLLVQELNKHARP